MFTYAVDREIQVLLVYIISHFFKGGRNLIGGIVFKAFVASHFTR